MSKSQVLHQSALNAAAEILVALHQVEAEAHIPLEIHPESDLEEIDPLLRQSHQNVKENQMTKR